MPGLTGHLYCIGSVVAQVGNKFGAMNDPFFVAPPITEIPDYVWAPRYGRSSWLPGKPVQKPVDISRKVTHPDAESALQAAKKACRGKPGRWFGRASNKTNGTEFLVYENGKVAERHIFSIFAV